jgi:hypothetical protein
VAVTEILVKTEDQAAVAAVVAVMTMVQEDQAEQEINHQ